MKSNLIAAAISGIALGVSSLAQAAPSHEKGISAGADHGARMLGDKHACKGQNGCKGQGGCKTDKHGCKGQNACKGQGGCKG